MRKGAAIVGLAVVMALAACGPASGPSPSASGSPSAAATATPSATPTAAPTPTPVPTATPTATPTPTPTTVPTVGPPTGFVCNGSFSGGSTSAGSLVTDVRVGAHEDEGYDRFVIEFSGAIPSWQVGPHSPSFEASPSGQPVTLEGSGGLLIRIQPVDDWTSYRAPNYFLPHYAYLREAKLLENFEAVQQWGLGIQGTPCIRVLTLDSPSRLVVDVYGG